ncbi:N-6 DNA methylase [Janthinobacterium sp. NFX145]|uniref:N-6 DNA methylase n=1 Tax=Janthinobacterium sp. NFX145 TaxID=3415602 RepID=UPI003CC62FF3
MAQADLFEMLRASGIDRDSIVSFDGNPTPRHIRYLDLISSTANGKAPGNFPDAVVETAGAPVIYIVRHDRLGDTTAEASGRLSELVRVLACRADARFLGVVRPGGITVYSISLLNDVPQPVIDANGEAARAKLRGLLSGAAVPSFTQSSKAAKRSNDASSQWLETLLFKLLSDAASEIKRYAPTLTVQQIIGLVGRALFFRFLVDRGIVDDRDAVAIAGKKLPLEEMFSAPTYLTNVCIWMDQTFNGDLLSLSAVEKDYGTFVQQIGSGVQEVCRHLSNIQHKAVAGQLPLNWGGIKFQHVPVGVLSQVYEEFAHNFLPDLAQTTSIHYTPRRIAEIVLDGAFSAVNSAKPHEAKVLDPSAGGGVFLVLALRRLVAERWKESGVRPTRAVIRKILNTQLTGFDINADALNIASLSLYLAALELDPRPSPLSELKFQKLIGVVLHPVGVADLAGSGAHAISSDDTADYELGSLSKVVLDRFASKFDIVVGNPPWTGFKGQASAALNKRLAQLISHDGQVTADIRARYGSPDVAFLLASKIWAKPSAAIGFALHGRLLFQPKSFELRRHIFKTLQITGIMNFASLRQDPRIWGSNDAPFLLMVARNDLVSPGDSFYFISPKREQNLNALGQFRIDPNAATPVSLQQVQDDPLAIKALYKGGALGLELMDRIRSARVAKVAEQISKWNLKFTSGYQSGKPEKRKEDSSALVGLPEVSIQTKFGLRLGDASEKFTLKTVQWRRNPQIYKGPLLLFRESPKLDRSVRGALYCEVDVVYKESFFGLTLPNDPGMRVLADLLYVVSYSDLMLYYQLLSSPKFGVERDSGLQSDLEEFPLINHTRLSDDEVVDIKEVAAKLRNHQHCWNDVDRLTAKLYDLSAWDVQLIQDTLAAELPFAACVTEADAPPTTTQIEEFARTFKDLLEPYSPTGLTACVLSNTPGANIEGWRFLRFVPDDQPATDAPLSKLETESLTDTADSYWASRLIVHLDGNQLVLGLLDQSRYWSPTQARLLALEGLQDGSLFV